MTRVLVIKLSALGDMVLAFTPFAAIRAHHPRAHIVLLTTAPFAPLMARSPWFDDVWVDERPRGNPIHWLDLRHRLKAGRFNRVYDLQTNDRTRLYHWLGWPYLPQWSGIVGSLSVADQRRAPLHALERHRIQLARAGITALPATPDLGWLGGDGPRFALPRRFALLAAGAAPGRPAKRWPQAHFAELARGLLARGITPVLLGTDGEAGLNATIAAAAPGSLDLTRQTSLGDIVALARLAECALGNDTGPMHLCAAAGCRSLVLFGGDSDPARSRPVGPDVRWLQRADMEALTPAEALAALGL